MKRTVYRITECRINFYLKQFDWSADLLSFNSEINRTTIESLKNGKQRDANGSTLIQITEAFGLKDIRDVFTYKPVTVEVREYPRKGLSVLAISLVIAILSFVVYMKKSRIEHYENRGSTFIHYVYNGFYTHISTNDREIYRLGEYRW